MLFHSFLWYLCCWLPQSDWLKAELFMKHRLFWMRVTLRPELATPICASAKLVHTHMKADQSVYAGMAFDFTFNADHQRFVVSQICRFVEEQQRHQLAA